MKIEEMFHGRVSRFVTWEPVFSLVHTTDSSQSIELLLKRIGIDSVATLNGLEGNSLQDLTTELEKLLLEYDLGIFAHAYWPTDRSLRVINPHFIADQSVEILQLSVRSCNCLLRADIATIGELLWLSDDDLMRLPNMGKTSVMEIRRKVSELHLDGVMEQPRSEILPGWFSLATLLQFEACGIPEKIAERLRSVGINDMHDLLLPVAETVRVRASLKPAEMQGLQTRLVSFGLRFGSCPPLWITEHLKEVRAAFSAEIDGFESPLETDILEGPDTRPGRPLPSSLEEELEGLVPLKARAQRLPIIRRVLGWDGGSGTTLETAGKEFGLTRERIRQIISSSIPRQPMPVTSFLCQAIDTTAERTPCAADQAESALMEHGLVSSAFRLEGILATAHALGIDVPWQVKEGNSSRAVIGPGDANEIEEFHREARRRVSHFGVTNKSYVLAELGGQWTLDFADLCCSLAPDLKWLDVSHDWFWVPTSRNAISSRLAKILRVTPQIDIRLALVGVLRDRRIQGTELPLAIFRSFCNLMHWCRADEIQIFTIDELPPEDEQDSNEVLITRVLQQNGPVMWRRDLWHLAHRGGVEKVSFDRYLSESNVIVRVGPEIYGLIGSKAAPTGMAEPALVPNPYNSTQARLPVIEDPPPSGEASIMVDSEPFLKDCDPSSGNFPLQLLARCVQRSAQLRRYGLWSLAELHWAEEDLRMIRTWCQIGTFDFTEIRRQSVTYGSARMDGAEAVALTFLACCSDIAMARAEESEMWPMIQSGFEPGLRSRLFQGPGNPKVRIREATERICSKLGIRHVFGREGEQSWRRTVFLQFGMTRSGRQRLPWWLTDDSTVPVAVEDLLSSQNLRSESFGEFWRTLQRYRAGQISYLQAFSLIKGNPWVPASEVEAALSAALDRRDLQRSGKSLEASVESADRLFGAPLLSWRRETPVFDIPLKTGSRWLTEPRYVLVLHNSKRVIVTRREEEYRLEGKLEVELTTHEVTIDLRLNQVSCLPKPLRISLTPEDTEFVFYDLATGDFLPSGNEKFIRDHAYALLARSSLELTVEALEMRRVFDGEWILRAYRNGIPPSLEIHRNNQVVWTIRDASETFNERLVPKFRIGCGGGRWGEPATFTVEPIPEMVPTHLLICGRRIRLEISTAGTFRASLALTPDLNFENLRVRVECITKNRVRWFGAEVTMGSVQGIAIETEDGWKVLKENADVDAEYLRVHRILTRLPSRFGGEDVSIDDWAWMEGPHFCGRPRISASAIGATVHAVGDSLRLSTGPYNRPLLGGTMLARSVIHSGVVGWIESSNSDWQLQFRRSFELGEDHDIWVWPSQSEIPRVLDRSTWWQNDNICHVRYIGESPLALAVSFKGAWLGARTSVQGWAGFRDLLRACQDWAILAPWLKWWRVPLLHPALREEAAALARRAPIDTLRSWSFQNELSYPACFSEDYEDAWRMVTQTFLWDWLPTKGESEEALSSLGLLTGDLPDDQSRSWAGYEEMLRIHPLLFVQLAARGTASLYRDNSSARSTLLERLRNQLLDIDPAASYEAVLQALREAQQMAARAMAVDEVFVAKSLLRDAVAFLSGNLACCDNLRVALTNSYAVPQYLAATILHKMIGLEIS